VIPVANSTVFLNVLAQFGIRTWYRQSDIPQHNGKIEQFWQTLETTTGHAHAETTIANFIHHYNFVWKHGCLRITPQAARHGIPR
jgi:transposase InsO family protein